MRRAAPSSAPRPVSEHRAARQRPVSVASRTREGVHVGAEPPPALYERPGLLRVGVFGDTQTLGLFDSDRLIRTAQKVR